MKLQKAEGNFGFLISMFVIRRFLICKSINNYKIFVFFIELG